MNNTNTELIYIGFNSRVAALNWNTGEIVWRWRSPRGRGYVSLLLLENQQLIVSVIGYTYCLNALTGEQLWFNEMEGFGAGVASLIARNANSSQDALIAAAAESDRQSRERSSSRSAASLRKWPRRLCCASHTRCRCVVDLFRVDIRCSGASMKPSAIRELRADELQEKLEAMDELPA